MTSKHIGKAVLIQCSVCGADHQRHSDLCRSCQRKSDDALIGNRKCALCESEIPRSRSLISPYCSIWCANKAGKIGEKCAAAIAMAIKAGKVPRITENVQCIDCGRTADRYDHRDYSKPMDVEPVCRSCNRKRGPAKMPNKLPKIERSAA